MSGGGYYQSYSGELYDTYLGDRSDFAVSLSFDAFSGRGVSQGVTFSLLSRGYGWYRLTDYAVGLRFTYYLAKATNGDLKGRFLPFLRLFGEFQDGDTWYGSHYLITGGLQFGFDAMLSDAIAVEMGARWRAETLRGGSKFLRRIGLGIHRSESAYFLF